MCSKFCVKGTADGVMLKHVGAIQDCAGSLYIKGAFVSVMNEQCNSVKMHKINNAKIILHNSECW